MDVSSNQTPDIGAIIMHNQAMQRNKTILNNKYNSKNIPINVGNISTNISQTISESTLRQSNITHKIKEKTKDVLSLTTAVGDTSNYAYSSVSGGKNLIYNFEAPPEYLYDIPIDKALYKEGLVYYFSNLYPLSNEDDWNSMSTEQLLHYYKNMDFWYTFNTSWGVSPKPVVFDDFVISKWEKNTFYQAGTIINSNITSFGWDYDIKGNKLWYAARYNNAAQEDAAFEYTYKGIKKTVRSLCREKDYWESVRGQKIEVASWGWNPYPFGIYAQGPFRGSGNFLALPTNFTLGTCHWDIIMNNKADGVSREQIFQAILNHELSRIAGGAVGAYDENKKYVNLLPWVIIHDTNSNTYYWGEIKNNNGMGGYTPLLISYSCYLIGGFGGLGGFGNWWSAWKNTYRYTPLIELNNGVYTIPIDQSINNLNGFNRNSEEMWNIFDKMFSLIQAWDTNYAQNIWRHPDFPIGGLSPSVNNACDDLMQAYVTGNFDFVKYSLWGKTNPDESLCKNVSSKLTYSNKLESGKFKGFPYGYVTGGSASSCVVRTQMPNLNGDICLEIADFRVCTPGQLGDGSGDQNEWKKLMSMYAEKYYYTVNPHNPSEYKSFSGDFAPVFPDTDLKKAKMDTTNFYSQDNPLIGKTFFDFDVYMGTWTGELAYTGEENALKQLPMNTSIYRFQSSAYNNQTKKWVNLYDNCEVTIPSIKPSSGDDAKDILNIYGNPDCLEGQSGIYNSYKKLTYTKDTYYPFATDSFSTGIVGFQGNNFTSSIGSCQTRWWFNSKKIPWKMNAPIGNRLALNNGVRFNKNIKKNNIKINTDRPINYIIIMILSIVLCIVFFLLARKYNKLWYIGLVCSLCILIFSIYSLTQINSRNEEKKLRLYLTLVYPKTPISKWKRMSLSELKKFFLNLHFWYRSTDKSSTMPSPIDYLNDKEWNNNTPYDPETEWKSWSIRKKCVIGYPEVNNPFDGKIEIGNDKEVGMSEEDAPSCILYRGRQLLNSEGGNVQKSSFFTPAENFYIDDIDSNVGPNKVSLDYWRKAEYCEVSSQWGPFPDGSYYDWAQGSGVFMKLGKHVVGYSGMHVVYDLGVELLSSKNYFNKLEDVYFQEWQRTGVNGMTMKGTQLINPVEGWSQGLYGSIIFTSAQRDQIYATIDSSKQGYYVTYGNNFLADGNFWEKVNALINDPTPYYNAQTNTWVNKIPDNLKQYYIPNYPFPLPFGTKAFVESNEFPTHAQVYNYALTMPWKYQCFNIAFMFRHLVVDLLFLDETLADGTGTAQEYVDFLIANQKTPLKTPRTWKSAIDKLVNILGISPPNPILFKYPRTLAVGDLSKSLIMDGPVMIIAAEDNPSILRVQTGALDKTTYLQDTKTSGGVYFKQLQNLPQMSCADLEIDHWMSELAKKQDYDTIQRIQHWSGSKNMSADIELINLRVPILGNLIDNTLSTNIYEVWKNAFNSGNFVIRDPFDPNSHIYPIDNENDKSSTEITNADWVRPPWIGINADDNLYGWYCESLNTYNVVNRLAYPQISAQQIGFSNAYPEFNSDLWMHYSDKFLKFM